MSLDATENPISGLWRPTQLSKLYYGPQCVQKYLLSCLPQDISKAFIITGSSLAQRTSLITQVEQLLGAKHAGTFSSIKQHALIAQLDEATDIISNDTSIDTLVSIGGGSPIDSAKVISYRNHEKHGSYLYHIAIPTTLSAAECTMGAAYTMNKGQKTFIIHPELAPKAILYDATFAQATPDRLWLGTGLRALDHAMELMYHPTATEVPCKQMCLQAASDLLVYLPKYKENPKDVDVVTRLQLAAFASLGFLGLNMKPLGLSHALGYALGSPYGIPHGETSCLTLGHVVKLKARTDPAAAQNIARILPCIGQLRTGDNKVDGETVGDVILNFVKSLGLYKKLGEYGVEEDQVDIITKSATGGKGKGNLEYESVEALVKGLY
ncbi:Dehydroquinate synthase-like protein [Viridothelium virens]|uniref:Dehydroquinate synthase-like protein n=1 Tax=Viridothelium virens TaxID=1048519 RepID=A0A6A6H5H7_VIRVR|nr:Dehydroquinate synthase-like protein [Viridothelium virens]